jgi:hypothetical protein
MKTKTINMIWGIILIIAGGLFLAQNMGWIGEIPDQLWKFIFAGLSLLFFASYFINGIKEWGWLFPAFIFAALSITIALGEAGKAGEEVGALILGSIAAPFLIAYLLDRSLWWALIPAWVMFAISLVILFANRVPGEVTAALIMTAIALPFFVVYLTDRSRWWALIPAGVMLVVAFIPLIASSGSGEFIPVFIMLLLSLPFFAVFTFAPQNWWAIIPAGIMATIALGLLFIFSAGEQENLIVRSGGVFFLGWAATFGFLWLRRNTYDTEWAKYPASIMALIGLGVIILGAGFNNLWPLVMIAAGLIFLYYGLRRR